MARRVPRKKARRSRSRRRRHPKRNSALTILITEILSIVVISISIVRKDWAAVGWAACVAVAIPCWIIAWQIPTRCGVTTLKGRPCQNPTKGILFGCGKHTWDKLLARFGLKRRPATQTRHRAAPASPPRPADAAAFHELPDNSTVAVHVVESRRDFFAFWLALIATLAGSISAAKDITDIFKEDG
ncbi:hypothetical protein [Nonomuraea basaltis]|uniref:hypothetical protein n=1 Tax=Nonomuraea basaltis TaxID=2495887 RepID=UPI00110C46A3|nr:hypothetical protein [Nonomuraea basaltis]TMR89529.1 hypothetical protein EJK15_60335 [Nonomuraea basaltis]